MSERMPLVRHRLAKGAAHADDRRAEVLSRDRRAEGSVDEEAPIEGGDLLAEGVAVPAQAPTASGSRTWVGLLPPAV